MSKCATVAEQPVQLGFALDYVDGVTGNIVPWETPTAEICAELRAAPWKVVDVETTGLTPASEPVNLSARDIRSGFNGALRMRVNSVLYMNANQEVVVRSFDFDKLSFKEKREVAAATLSGVFIGHNAGFDTYWVRQHSLQEPEMVLDTMLLARLFWPDVQVQAAAILNDENEDPDRIEWATNLFIKKKGGFSLDDLVQFKYRVKLSKQYQKPHNWVVPFLSQNHYDYATGDVRWTYQLLCDMLESDGTDLLEAYARKKAEMPVISLIEPQVWEVVLMREQGMPVSVEQVHAYFEEQAQKLAQHALDIVAIEPALAEYLEQLSNPHMGVTEALKNAVGAAFTKRGVELDVTEKTSAPKIGEKDLRKVKALMYEDAALLFKHWVGLQKAKKAGNMAIEVGNFSLRSGDGRVHPLASHGPVTGRLSEAEPNAQQFPRDAGFRAIVAAREGHKILAADYSALDMRVGAALALRAQMQIMEVYLGIRATPNPKVPAVIRDVVEDSSSKGSALVRYAARETKLATELLMLKAKMPAVAADGSEKKAYWDKWRSLNSDLLLARFGRALAFVLSKAKVAGTPEWGSLRDAFNIEGMDIHTWTAMGMNGRDPKAEVLGMSDHDAVVYLKAVKKVLGDKRQSGKVANLGLLYAMASLGFQDYAAKLYNIHWEFSEADKVRRDWLATYVEVDLWHAWTELNPYVTTWVPDPERGGRIVKKDVFEALTLGNRRIFAFGLNAGLAFQDQSTGADILGTVMHNLHEKNPSIFKTIVNQVHDEIVFEIPSEKVESYQAIICDEMVSSAELFIGGIYGVKAEVGPAVGDVWLKD